jgi:hypothetical protein
MAGTDPACTPQEVEVAASLAEITKLTDSVERAKRAAELVHKHSPEATRRLYERDATIYQMLDHLGEGYGTGSAIAAVLGAKRNAFVRIKNRRASAESSGRLPKVERRADRDEYLRRIDLLHKQMTRFDEKVDAARDVRDSALAELFDPTHPQFEPSNEELARLIGVDPQWIYYMRRRDRVVRALRAFSEATGRPLAQDTYEAWRKRALEAATREYQAWLAEVAAPETVTTAEEKKELLRRKAGPDYSLPDWGIVAVAFRTPEKAAEAAGVPYGVSATSVRGRSG